MGDSQFVINGFEVGNPCVPYVIAEIGVNHEGSFELAKRLIEEAKAGGAHAAKFQSYKAHKIASKNSPAYWDTSKEVTKSQFELFKKYDSFDAEDYLRLADYCMEVGIDFMSTPFDLEAVDFLEPLVPAFKVASADINNVPLIRACARTGKPLIMSTGAATIGEIQFALNLAYESGAINVSLLHCVLNYPTPPNDARLDKIELLKREFPLIPVGYSDHVVPDKTMSSMECALLKGAVILEKHFTHDKSLPGNDHYHAMDKEDLSAFSAKLKVFGDLSQDDGSLESQRAAREHARRSIVVHGDISKGQKLTEENLIAKRPGHGISVSQWDMVVGREAAKDLLDDEILKWEDLV